MKLETVWSNYNEWTASWDSYSGLAAEFDGDLEERVTLLVSNDNWQQYDAGPKHRIETVEVPDWVVEGARRYVEADLEGAGDDRPSDSEVEAWVVAVASRRYFDRGYHYARALQWIEAETSGREAQGKKPAKFAASLRAQYVERGTLTPRQQAAARPYRRRA